jgi:hypothetical protein
MAYPHCILFSDCAFVGFHLRIVVLFDARHFGKLLLDDTFFSARTFKADCRQLIIFQISKPFTPRQRFRC